MARFDSCFEGSLYGEEVHVDEHHVPGVAVMVLLQQC